MLFLSFTAGERDVRAFFQANQVFLRNLISESAFDFTDEFGGESPPNGPCASM